MKQFPFIKFSLSFSLGIFFQHLIKLNTYFIVSLLFVYLFVFVFSVVKSYSRNFRSLIGLLIFFVLGCYLYHLSYSDNGKYPFNNYKIKDVEIFAEVEEIKLIKAEKLSLIVKLDSMKNNLSVNNSLKFICNIYESKKNLKSIYNQIKVGNKVYLKATIIKPRNQRNPFEFDYEKYLNEKGIYFVASVYNKDYLRIVDNSVSTLPNFIFEIRKYIDNKLRELYNNSTYHLLRGLILADRSEIDNQVYEDFINVGVIHVLAVSGLHVGYVVIIFLFLFSRFNLFLRITLTILGLIFFMILTGTGAPVVRASLMTSIILLLPLFGRTTNGLNSLFVAAFILLLINPRDLFNPSFQLSFSAILSLIIIVPIINKKLYNLKVNKFIKYIFLFIGTTFAAQIGTLPFIIAYFSKLSLISILANIFVIPLTGIILGLGIISIVLSFISTQIATYYASLNELTSFIILYLINKLGSLNFSSLNVKPFSLYDGILFYLLIGLLFSLIKYFNHSFKKLVFVVLIVSTFFIYEKIDDKELLKENYLSILTIDVGQGDAFLVKFPNNQTALIDAGNADINFDNGKKIVLPLMNKLGINKIDYAFVSHTDADHFMGFLSLIKNAKIKKIYKPYLTKDEVKDIKFENFINSKNIELHHYQKKKLQIGNAVVYILNNDMINNISKTINDKSGVIKIVYGKNSILFTGDLGIKMEKEYITQYSSFLKSDILKIGHHGSKTSTSENFIKSVSPKFALISVGIANKFKHPNKEVINRLKENKIKILRTDYSGAILINSDGKNLSLINWKN